MSFTALVGQDQYPLQYDSLKILSLIALIGHQYVFHCISRTGSIPLQYDSLKILSLTALIGHQ